MEDNALQAWIRYWQLAWKKAPNAKRFSFYRVLPPVLSATAQFVWFRANRPMTQLWISIGLICAVYIFLFAIESIWNCVAVSPVKIHAEQVDKIAALGGENADLKDTLSSPAWVREMRKREAVREMLAQLGDVGRKVIGFILDHGDTPVLRVMQAKLGQGTHQTLCVAKNLNLVQERTSNNKTILTINPDLKSAVEFVLAEKKGET